MPTCQLPGLRLGSVKTVHQASPSSFDVTRHGVEKVEGYGGSPPSEEAG